MCGWNFDDPAPPTKKWAVVLCRSGAAVVEAGAIEEAIKEGDCIVGTYDYLFPALERAACIDLAIADASL